MRRPNRSPAPRAQDEPLAAGGGAVATVPPPPAPAAPDRGRDGPARQGATLARLSTASGVVSTRLSERLSERRAARRRLTLARLAILLGVAAAVGFVAWLLLGAPLLALRGEAVGVTSSGPAADPSLVAAAVTPWSGTPLARISTADVEAAVERVEGVRAASVRRDWPHGLSVDVEARVPVAAVPLTGRYALLDVDGVQVGELVAAPPAGVPVAAIPPRGGAEVLGAVLDVLDALPAGLLGEVTDVSAHSADSVGFRLSDGARVEWGSAELSELKARVLEILRQRPAQVYDVSAPTMPVIR